MVEIFNKGGVCGIVDGLLKKAKKKKKNACINMQARV